MKIYEILSKDQLVYMEGQCHIYAVALHRKFGHGFLMMCDMRYKYAPGVYETFHVYGDDGSYLYDVSGKHIREDIISGWRDQSRHFDVVELKTEQQFLRFVGDGDSLPLTRYKEESVQEAIRFINTNMDKER